MDVIGPVWLNGKLTAPQDATISILDHGLTVGDGVFETIKVVDEAAFGLTRHLARLRRSATALRLSVPYTDVELAEAVGEVIAANPEAGRLRVTVTGGPGPMGSGRGDAEATVIVAASKASHFDAETKVLVVPWRRNEYGALAGVKSTSYAENVIALDLAAEQGAGEAIFANTSGNLCEGTGANIFVGIGGELVTPPLSSGCLAGTVREILVEILDVSERDIPIGELAMVDEAFLTSSTREIQPISQIDDTPLVHCPGPLTIAARAAFDELKAKTLDP